MRHSLFLLFAVCTQISLAQYAFRYEPKNSYLNEIKVENQASKEVMNAMTGVTQDRAETSTGECQFNTSGWQPGIYLIRASNGTDTISKKITIK